MANTPGSSAGTTSAGPPMLTWWERSAAAVVALGVGVLAYAAEVHPPTITKAANSSACTTESAKACVVSVSSDTSTLVVALVAFAAVAALIAILGIRFTKVTAAGASLESDVTATNPAAAEKATGGQLAASREALLSRRGSEPPDLAPDAVFRKLPDWVQASLIRWANTQSAVTKPIAYALLDAAKETGRGNKPWFVTVEQDSGDTLVLRVATGRGGTSIEAHEAT